MVIHPIPPVYNEESTVLILGSFPSIKSREEGFFYGHPQNRFWKVIAAVAEHEIPKSVEEKRNLLLDSGIGVWDVIASCDIVGSSDSSIKNVVANDIKSILDSSNISRIYVNGKTAEKYYNKYILPYLGIPAVCLPSTSPANAAWSLDKLTNAWKNIIMR